MLADEIVKLSREGILDLLRERARPDDAFGGGNRRRRPRWPFPGTIELWPADGDGTRQWFGTCHNLSEGGLGITCDDPFEADTPLEIAFHLPEASFYGKATVRHCLETPRGYMIGLQFDFAD